MGLIVSTNDRQVAFVMDDLVFLCNSLVICMGFVIQKVFRRDYFDRIDASCSEDTVHHTRS